MERKIDMMGGQVKLNFYDLGEETLGVCFDEIREYALKMQRKFNFYDKKSELSMLNKKREMKVSEEMLYVIKNAVEYCKKTAGKYDISIGKQVMQRKQKQKVTGICCSYKDIKIEGNRVRLENDDVLLDLGSVAKGYIADKIAEKIMEMGIENALIDARGDMRIVGRYSQTVMVQHPRDRNKTIHPISLKNGALATSGDYNQYDTTYENCHIVGRSRYSSVTVFAENLMKADMCATCIFLMDKEEAEEFAEQNNVKALAITKDLNTEMFNGFEQIMGGGRD